VRPTPARPTTWPLVLVLLLAVAGGVRVVHAHRSPPERPPGRPVAPTVVRAAGAALAIPRGWRRVETGDDHATWAAPDRSASVTLGVVPAAAPPLATVVSASVRELRRALPGLRSLRVDAAADGGPRVEFEVVRAHGRLEVLQLWHRDERRGRDVVTTWSWAHGSPAPPPRRGVLRGAAHRP
jgi:hypothetical protein